MGQHEGVPQVEDFVLVLHVVVVYEIAEKGLAPTGYIDSERYKRCG